MESDGQLLSDILRIVIKKDGQRDGGLLLVCFQHNSTESLKQCNRTSTPTEQTLYSLSNFHVTKLKKRQNNVCY